MMLKAVNFSNEAQVIKRPPPKLTKGEGAKAVFQGKLFTVWQWPQRLYDGSQTVYESLTRADTVTMLAFTKDKQLIMTRQSQPQSGEFWSFPGGIMDEGETVLQAAQRELLEETGFASQDWYFLFASQISGKIDWANFYLVAKDAEQVAAQNLDAGEKIRLEFFDQKRLDQLIKKEEFRQQDFVVWYFKQQPAVIDELFAKPHS